MTTTKHGFVFQTLATRKTAGVLFVLGKPGFCLLVTLMFVYFQAGTIPAQLRGILSRKLHARM